MNKGVPKEDWSTRMDELRSGAKKQVDALADKLLPKDTGKNHE